MGVKTSSSVARILKFVKGRRMEALPRFDLQGKVARVTASARGLGRAIALALAEAGARVAVGLRDAVSQRGGKVGDACGGRRALKRHMGRNGVRQVGAA